jgi:hypothetical protein
LFNFGKEEDMKRLILVSVIIILLGCSGHDVKPVPIVREKPLEIASLPTTQPEEDIILNTMEKEMKRAIDKLKIEGQEKPYFISYILVDFDTLNIEGNFGALTNSARTRIKPLMVDVRVGNYRVDNSKVEPGPYSPELDMGEMMAEGALEYAQAPLEDNPDRLRHLLWLATDYKYKKAIVDYEKKKSSLALEEEDKERPDDFSQGRPSVSINKLVKLNINKEEWEKKTRDYSALFKKYPYLTGGKINFTVVAMNQYFLNSEGSKIRFGEMRYEIRISASAKAKDGMNLTLGRNFYATSVDKLPSKDKISQEIENLAKELTTLKDAEVIKSYKGPVLFEGGAAGVFMLEVLGRALQADPRKFKDNPEFLDKLNEKIMPDFISVYDDPALKTFNDECVAAGHYAFDDEGIPAQRVNLVEKGVLKGFLLSRSPVKGFSKSNGHGRASAWGEPKASIGNLIIESTKRSPTAELKKLLIEECKRKNEPFGLIIKSLGKEDEEGGYRIIIRGQGAAVERGTTLKPILLYKINVDNGKEELLRGAEIAIRSPLTIIDKIVAVGNDQSLVNLENESVISPSLLFSEMAVKKEKAEKGSEPILPAPPLE